MPKNPSIDASEVKLPVLKQNFQTGDPETHVSDALRAMADMIDERDQLDRSIRDLRHKIASAYGRNY